MFEDSKVTGLPRVRGADHRDDTAPNWFQTQRLLIENERMSRSLDVRWRIAKVLIFWSSAAVSIVGLVSLIRWLA